MRHLLIYRHAHTLPAERRQTDHDRSLSPRGIEESGLQGAYLKELQRFPDKTLCSTATRTRETWQHTQAAMEKQGLETDFNPALYLATPLDIARQIQQVKENAYTLMVVGHNPGLHQFCLSITDPAHAKESTLALLHAQFPPATLAIFACNVGSWREFSLTPKSMLLDISLPSVLADLT